MAISSLVRIEICPTVLVVNPIFVAVGVGILFVDRSFVDRSVVDRSGVHRSRVREVLGCVVTTVVREMVRPGPGRSENQNCQGHNKELRMIRT